MRKIALVAVAGALALGACTSASNVTPSEPPSSTATATESPSEVVIDSQEGTPLMVLKSANFDTWGGGDVFLTAITAGAQPLSARIELDAADQVEWQAEYVKQAIQDGSGLEIDMGDSNGILRLIMRGMRYPEADEQIVTGADIEGMVVVTDPPFEGQSAIFFGLPDAMNYRIDRVAGALIVTFIEP